MFGILLRSRSLISWTEASSLLHTYVTDKYTFICKNNDIITICGEDMIVEIVKEGNLTCKETVKRENPEDPDEVTSVIFEGAFGEIVEKGNGYIKIKVSDTKVCITCKEEKGEGEFYANKVGFDGTFSKCDVCVRKHLKDYRDRKAKEKNEKAE